MTHRPRRLPAAASAALKPLLTGPPRPVTVLAAFPRALYLQHDGGIIAAVTADGIHQPNALVLSAGSDERPLAGCVTHQRGLVGTGGLSVGPLDLEVARWWRPRPTLRPVAPDRLRQLVREAAALVGPGTGPDLHTAHDAALLPARPEAGLAGPFAEVVLAVRAEDRRGAVVAARALLGRGPGLTPAGDDLLAGLVAGALLLAPPVGDPPLPAPPPAGLRPTAAALGLALARLAPDATPAISASLLSHAVRGEVAAPAAGLLRALTGHGNLPAAVAGLLAVGATSGRELAAGLLAGAGLAAEAAAMVGTHAVAAVPDPTTDAVTASVAAPRAAAAADGRRRAR